MEDNRVDTMEIDGQQQQQQGVGAALPDGFNTDYLRIYYGKCRAGANFP
jgi:DNA primase small subunit